MNKQPVCIYIDNSNIFIGGKEYAKSYGEDPAAFRIDFNHFFELVTSGNSDFDEMVWAGSGDENTESMFSSLRSRGVDVIILRDTEEGESETVDMAIQLAMYRHARKYRRNPGTMVLCTGDGKGLSREEGFLYDVTGFIDDGWQLKLFSWDAICHHGLKSLALEKGIYEPLEKYYKAITFMQDGRKSEGLSQPNTLADNLP